MGAKKKAVKEKPLEKMTAKELREIGKQIPEITGVYGMNKAELVGAIKKARGIAEDVGKKRDTSVREIKKKIKALKLEHETAVANKEEKMAKIYRRRISRLKKKTRRVA
jgi:hypothetical protein